MLVCGSRSFHDYEKLVKTLDLFYDLCCEESMGIYPFEFVIIEGGANGADKLAAQYAKSKANPSIELIELTADWTKFGKSAGYIRNEQMINLNPDMVIAFWDGVSAGTKHTIGLAKDRKIRTYIIYV